jgi:hypothetical protein
MFLVCRERPGAPHQRRRPQACAHGSGNGASSDARA